MYRPFVTFADGLETFLPANVVTEAERQHVIACASQMALHRLNISNEDAAKIPPARARELAAKVQFFRVAMG